jgi:hypothetical protein
VHLVSGNSVAIHCSQGTKLDATPADTLQGQDDGGGRDDGLGTPSEYNLLDHEEPSNEAWVERTEGMSHWFSFKTIDTDKVQAMLAAQRLDYQSQDHDIRALHHRFQRADSTASGLAKQATKLRDIVNTNELEHLPAKALREDTIEAIYQSLRLPPGFKDTLLTNARAFFLLQRWP